MANQQDVFRLWTQPLHLLNQGIDSPIGREVIAEFDSAGEIEPVCDDFGCLPGALARA